jgi:hypothetical protein
MDQPVTTRDPQTPAPRPRRASWLWLIGAVLVAYSTAIAMTGGIDVTLAGVRIRSRTWQRPAVLAIVCLATVAISDRRRALGFTLRAVEAAGRIWSAAVAAISPRALAATATLWALCAGLIFGTSIAGGADSSGYLNQARLFSEGRMSADLRLLQQRAWPDGVDKLVPLGFRLAQDRRHLAPIYPPGYPLLMAPAFRIDERAAYLVVPFGGALVVWLTFAMGEKLRQPAAGAAAACLVSVSPTFLYQLVQPMSDVPVTAAWLAALYVASTRTTANAACAGLAAGIAILIRPNLMPLAGLVWCTTGLGGEGGSRWRRAAASIAATIPGAAALGLIQSARYGSPFASGYGSVHDLFGLANVWPNLARYPRWMIESHTPLIVLFLAAPVWLLWRRQQARGFLLLLWVFAVAVVLAYLPYVYFQSWEWTYTRFLLPAIPIMWLLITLAAYDLLRRLGRPLTALVVAPVVLCVLGFSLWVARERFVFELKDGEKKYVFTGDYARHHLPANAVVFSMQHSGSLWFYTPRPIVRWDHLDSHRLDVLITRLTANGYAPAIIVDRDELDQIRLRFGSDAVRVLERARLVAQFGDAVIYTFE